MMNKRTENIYTKVVVNIKSDWLCDNLETEEDDFDFNLSMKCDYEINDQNNRKHTSKLAKGYN